MFVPFPFKDYHHSQYNDYHWHCWIPLLFPLDDHETKLFVVQPVVSARVKLLERQSHLQHDSFKINSLISTFVKRESVKIRDSVDMKILW